MITEFERTEKAWVFEQLDFSSCNLTDKHLQSLKRLAPYTAFLSVRENSQMSPLSLGLLTDHIITQNFCCLDTINFSNCGLTDEHIKAMKNLIPAVKRIFLNENKMITAIGWRHFSDAIKSAYKQRLQYIAASRCDLSAKLLPVFLEGAQMSKEINLSGNKLLEPHSELPFLQFTFVNSINLSDCNLKDNGLAMISKMIPSLNRIDVSRNRTITVNGLKKFCDLILQNVMFQLDRISFEDCNLTNDHLHAVHGAFLLIKEVSIRNNKRLTIGAFSELSNAIISANTLKLENLDISNCNISRDHIVKMKEMIPLLKGICLDNNKTITAACLRYLADVISLASVSNLDKVSLCDCNISDQYLQGFSKALLRLKTVNLRHNNKVSNNGLQSFASAASNNTCICTSLGLQDCDLRNSDLDVFHQNRNVSVASIYKRGNNLLTEDIFIHLNIEDFYRNDNLDMTWLKFNDRTISKLLSKYPLAAKLDLSGQKKITSTGYTAITTAILESDINRMQSLVLQHCQLIDSDIQAMCTLLPYLKELDVSYNKTITPAGIKSMSLAIGDSVSCSLEVVKFKGCNITNCHVDMMDKVIEQVKVLELSGNKFICENGWKRFSHFVTSKEHLKLEKLVVQDCNLNLSCLKSLQDVVSVLVELDVKGNYLLKAADYSYLSKIISEPDNCNLTTVACDDLVECEVQVMGKALALFHTLKLQSSTILSSETLQHLSTAITQSHHCHLEVLDLSKITLTDLQLEKMLNTLHLFQQIDLSDNNQATTSSNLQMLSTQVEVLSKELGLKLNTVKLRCCDITDEKIRSMQSLIPNIEKLDVSFNKTIQPVGLTYIGTALMERYSTSRLKCLSLAGCNLNKSHLKCLTNILPILKEVIFDENKLLEVTDVAYISNVITNCETMQLESISFNNCGIRDGHVKVMGELLIRMKTVDLSSNPSISKIGCTLLSNHITLNDDCALECLKLQNCNVTLTKLMVLLPAVVKLKDIQLSNNPYLQPEEIKKVLNAVNLSDFSDLGCNLVQYFSLTDEHIRETATYIPSVKNLVLSPRGFYSIKGIAELASSILKSQTIKTKTVNMSGDYLTDEYVEALSEVFPLMEVIDLSGNKRLTRKAIKSLGNAINSAENVKIKELILKDINCSAGHIEEIITFVGKLKTFTLNLNNNKTITPSCLRKLSQHIRSSSDQFLTSLSLANCNLQECHLQSMSELISNIKTLDISQNKLITPKGLTHLLSNLSVTEMVKLTDLSLNNCNIEEKHLGALSKTIGFLKTLNLSNNNTISPAGITSLSSHLHTMESVSLETVRLENCNLHHAHFDAMGVLLRHIKSLNVSGNRNMSEKDMIHMTMVVNAEQSNLENINLSNCNLKLCHLVAISPMLPRLKKIDLKNNWSIALNGIKSLLKDASTSKICNLETISISDCNINVKAVEVVFSLAPSIKEIDFSKNRRITATDLSSIAQDLRSTNGSRLETLNLSDCGIGDEHLKTLSEMMPQMKKIILNNNRRITYAGLKHVSDVLEKCLQQQGHVKLREVQLQNCNPSAHWEKLSKWNAFFKIVV